MICKTWDSVLIIHCETTFASSYPQPQEAVKAEEVAAKDVEMKDVTNTEYKEEVKQEEGEGGSAADKKKASWLNRSKEGGIKKLPKEVVRRRRNFRLKKMLTPKVGTELNI